MTAGDQVEELDLEAIGNRAATGRNVSKYAQRQGLDDDFASAIEASYRDEPGVFLTAPTAGDGSVRPRVWRRAAVTHDTGAMTVVGLVVETA